MEEVEVGVPIPHPHHSTHPQLRVHGTSRFVRLDSIGAAGHRSGLAALGVLRLLGDVARTDRGRLGPRTRCGGDGGGGRGRRRGRSGGVWEW